MPGLGKHRDFFARVESYCERLVKVFRIAGGLALALLLATTVADVFWRNLLNDALLGAEDLSEMSLTVVVAAAIASGAREGSHVSVNLIARFVGQRVTRVTDAVAGLLGACATGAAAYAAFVVGSCGLPCGDVTGSLSIPHTPFYYALGASLAVYGLLLASRLLGGPAVGPDEPGE